MRCQGRGEVLAQLRRQRDALRRAPDREAQACEDPRAVLVRRGAVAEDRRAGDLLDAVVALVRDVDRRQHQVGLLLGDAARLDVGRQRDDLAAVAERLERRRSVLGQRHDLRRLRRGASRSRPIGVLHLHRVRSARWPPARSASHTRGAPRRPAGGAGLAAARRVLYEALSPSHPQGPVDAPTPDRLFTAAEANAALPQVRPAVAALRRAIAEFAASAPAVEAFAARAAATGGTQPSPSERAARDRFRAGRGGGRDRAGAACTRSASW